MTSDSTRREPGRFSRRRMAAGGLAALVVSAGAVYGIVFAAGNGGAEACEASPAMLRAMNEAAQGEVAAMRIVDAPAALPELSFVDGDGKTRTLAEWRGRTVLLNLWATWCVPCREEMPALDALQAEMGGEAFEVVPVNIDRGDDDKPRRFLDETGIERLALFRDPKSDVFNALKRDGLAFGLPTTLIVDEAGCVAGHMAGPADWASEDAKALIRAASGEDASG